MAKIDGTSDLLAALRSQLAGKSGKASSATSNRTRDVQDTGLSARSSVGPDALQARIGGDLKRVDLTTPLGKKKARQIFIESVLAWDLGEDLVGDGQFGNVVRDVEESISSDQKLSDQLDQILLSLRGSTNSDV